MIELDKPWRNRSWTLDARFLDWRIVSLFVSALYPTVFALSLNWYALSSAKIVWLLAVVGAALPLAAYLLVRLLGGLFTLGGPRATTAWRSNFEPVSLALLCSGFLFLLFAATFQALIRSPIAHIGLFALFAALLARLFIKGRQRYFNAAMLTLILVAGATWIASFASYKISALAGDAPAGPEGLAKLSFVETPNIYFFIYDAYSSRDAYLKVHHFDNSEQYRKLEAEGFKVIHTFSNYMSTWPTTLSFFLGRHHYYELDSGVDDSKFGRSIMAGLAPNPAIDVLRTNGYRIQYIHHDDYFVVDRGVIDFVYPDVPAYSALAVFGSPLLGRLIGSENLYAKTMQKEEQLRTLHLRIPPPQSGSRGPWFTFSHVDLPSHSDPQSTWRELGDFSEDFKDRTLKANTHMSEVVAAIRERDPNAIVILLGDHGGWRYRKIWGAGGDLNAAMHSAGVDPQLVALDISGIMIAIYSGGRCDRLIYPGLTPVNVMRVIFACLSHDDSLLEHRAPDISLLRPQKSDIWVVARDGAPLPLWQHLQ